MNSFFKTFTRLSLSLFFLIIGLTSTSVQAQSLGKTAVWNKSQLIEPAALVSMLKNPKATKPTIYNIGFVSNIPGAKSLGAANSQAGLAKLKKAVAGLPATQSIIIYCGCCPFEHCPNVKPAYQLLKNLGYQNTKILNLPTSLKADWIDKGYQLSK